MRRAVGAGLAGSMILLTTCATDPGVRTEEAALIAPPTTAVPGRDPIVDWAECPGIDELPVTDVWECTWVEVPLDRAAPDATRIEVALTRPVLGEGDDRRPLVLEPGGPGASGVEFAWTFADLVPFELLDEFYPVGWDPRGVGLSRPAVDCGPLDGMGVPSAAECRERTGELLGFVGAADAALDLEEVRVALGVERLDYLGFSYGTALGSVYAMAHPDRVGHFVLDGAIDPRAGDPTNVLAEDGVPDYAADERDDVVARFFQLCDASPTCAAGPGSEALTAQLEGSIQTLPTEHFAGDPEQLSRIDLDELLDGATFDPWSWGLIGDALRDGGDGDASALAGLAAYQLEGFFESSVEQFTAANFAIHCADFSDVAEVWGCEGMPDAADLPVITTVDVAVPMLVIGTRYDPSTPGRHAAELAAALGDAVPMLWEGVGHTAYPTNTCVDGAVADLLIDGVLPPPGLQCPFVDGETTDEGIAEVLFGYPRPWIGDWIESELVYDGMGPDRAACMARGLARADHRVQTHVILDVTSPAATAALDAAGAAC
jgi:pimeloyl-ACP methyl ester carboxylesterase